MTDPKNIKNTLDLIRSKDIRAVAKAISLTENNDPLASELHEALLPYTGNANVVGITGPPGSGKSTLVDHLAVELKNQGKKVAILAIDPTSPFSGGAILGDRIRMNLAAENDIFVRSIASRGATGGLSRFTFDTIRVLDAAGYDVVLVETVGVGQVEVDIVRAVDTCIVVLIPGMGDTVQTFKAGIIEIADIFVINKADYNGADLVYKDLRLLMSLDEEKKGKWDVPIVKTIAKNGEGSKLVVEEIFKHKVWLQKSDHAFERKLKISKGTLEALINDFIKDKIATKYKTEFEEGVFNVANKKETPYKAAKKIFNLITK